MPKIVFIEGVSGVGKSTMIRTLTAALEAMGKTVRAYVEFDFTNPIDFYCTAYFYKDEYDALCIEHTDSISLIRRYSIPAGDAVLVRYFDEDTPLFDEPLLSKMRQAEFCYHPKRLVPMTEYTAAYKTVWQNFIAALDPTVDFYLFDGSLLHHPINDIMRNYHADGPQADRHVKVLLDTLGSVDWCVHYLYTDDIAAQLTLAHKNRGQCAPTSEEIRFWETRHINDRYVLEHRVKNYRTYCVSEIGWSCAEQQILQALALD